MTTCYNRSGSPLVGAGVTVDVDGDAAFFGERSAEFDGGVGDVGEVDWHGVES